MWADILIRGILIGIAMTLVWVATRPWMLQVWRDDGAPYELDRIERMRRAGREAWEVDRGGR